MTSPPIRRTLTEPERLAATTAGYALLLMAITAVLAYFVAIESLIVAGNASQTVANIRGAEGQFRAGIAGFVFIAILDVVAACALFVLLEPVNRIISLMAGAFRLVYAAILGVASAQLLNVLPLMNRTIAEGEQATFLEEQALGSIEAFNGIWEFGLALFGVHLVLVGWLCHRGGKVPRFVSLLVVVAGFGYLVDSLGAVLVSGYALSIASFAFVGEVLLMFWLLFGFRAHEPRSGRRSASEPELEVAR